MATINWDEAIDSGNFITLEEDKPVELLITNWRVEEVEKEFKGKKELKKEFQSDVLEKNGEKVEGVVFNNCSTRLKTKLKAVIGEKDSTETIKLSVLKIGDKFNTNYSVREIK